MKGQELPLGLLLIEDDEVISKESINSLFLNENFLDEGLNDIQIKDALANC